MAGERVLLAALAGGDLSIAPEFPGGGEPEQLHLTRRANDEGEVRVLQCLADEIRLQEVATRHGVCRTTVQKWRNQLTDLVRAFMGDDALRQFPRVPAWQENLRAFHEQLACRMERRVA